MGANTLGRFRRRAGLGPDPCPSVHMLRWQFRLGADDPMFFTAVDPVRSFPVVLPAGRFPAKP